MRGEVGLERGERKVVGAGVVGSAPHAEGTDRSVEDPVRPAARGRAVAATTPCEREDQRCAQREQKRVATHGA